MPIQILNQEHATPVSIGSLSNLMLNNGLFLTTAESCTGGYAGHLVTSIAGSSRYFEGSTVTYSYAMKKQILAVDDSKAIRFLLQTVLGKSYQVITVPDGCSAMHWLSKRNFPHLIIASSGNSLVSPFSKGKCF